MGLSRCRSARLDIPDGVGLVDIMALLDESDEESSMRARYRRRAVDTLLDAIEIPGRDVTSGHSIWVHESNHRAANMVQLILRANKAANLYPKKRGLSASDPEHINKLASTYRSLHRLDAEANIACGPAIKAMVLALLALFASSTKPVTCSFQLSNLVLRASPFRALMLIISEFTIRVLANCSRKSCTGHLVIAIQSIESNAVRVTIETNICLSEHFTSPNLEVVSGLAGILASELTFREIKGHGTVAVFEFDLVQESRTSELIG